VRLLTGPRGGISIERRLLPSRDGRVWLEQRFRGHGTRTIVTHGATIVTEIAVREGSLSFSLASGEIEAPPAFVIALPPRSALPLRLANARIDSRGAADFGAACFDAPLLVAAASLDDVPHPWRADDAMQLDPDSAVPVRVRRARRALHDLIAHPAPVACAARRVGLARETLARGFARAYGVSPKQYCQRARVFEAVLRLLSGAQVLEAGLDAGFADVGRFYAAFRRVVGTTPGRYALVKNRQDSGA
jgi:AraC-like DNA-binding protein